MLTELDPAAHDPVPLAELTEHLRLSRGFAETDEAEAALLAAHLRAATAAVERETGRALIARDFRLELAAWRRPALQVLPVAPVSAVVSVTLFDRDGAPEAVDPARWALRRDVFLPCLCGPNGRDLPRIPTDGRVEVVFTAGHGPDWNATPPDLRQAVLMLAAHHHEERHAGGSGTAGWAPGFEALIARWRRVRL